MGGRHKPRGECVGGREGEPPGRFRRNRLDHQQPWVFKKLSKNLLSGTQLGNGILISMEYPWMVIDTHRL